MPGEAFGFNQVDPVLGSMGAAGSGRSVNRISIACDTDIPEKSLISSIVGPNVALRRRCAAFLSPRAPVNGSNDIIGIVLQGIVNKFISRINLTR